MIMPRFNCAHRFLLATLLWTGATTGAEPPAAPSTGPSTATSLEDVAYTLPNILRKVPKLKHDATGRLPLVSIEIFKMSKDDQSFSEGKPLPPEMIRELKARGFTQYIIPDEKYIAYAQALQKEGAGVVMVQGLAFNGPPDEVPNSMHILPEGYKGLERPGQQPKFPCPMVLDGWVKKQGEYRALFRKYKEAGVKVDGVWLDWEIEPYAGDAQRDEAKHCSRCREQFPKGVLEDKERYRAFIDRWRVQIFSAYIVAPIFESYPGIPVNNWEEIISTIDLPTPSWSGSRMNAHYDIGMYSATNPVAYGNTIWKKYNWKGEWNWPLDVAHMDRVYTQVMLGQFSRDAANIMRVAPETRSIPWVDRYCADDRDPSIPILSRTRYREILRHLWLRGADTMQVFNPQWFPDDVAKTAIVTEELEDVVMVYDEMLAYRKFLDDGQVMNTEIIQATDDGGFWSGLRLGDQAIVRTFTQGASTVKVKIRPFEKAEEIELDCPPAGATFFLNLSEGKVVVEAKP